MFVTLPKMVKFISFDERKDKGWLRTLPINDLPTGCCLVGILSCNTHQSSYSLTVLQVGPVFVCFFAVCSEGKIRCCKNAFNAQSILNRHHSLVSMMLGTPSLCTLTNTYVAALLVFAERIKQLLTADWFFFNMGIPPFLWPLPYYGTL